MKKTLYMELQGMGKDLGFIANVILCHCRKPKTKLRNLKKLLDAGYDVRSAQFDMFSIVVNSEVRSLSWLDSITVYK